MDKNNGAARCCVSPFPVKQGGAIAGLKGSGIFVIDRHGGVGEMLAW
jgi:hypothetical protein